MSTWRALADARRSPPDGLVDYIWEESPFESSLYITTQNVLYHNIESYLNHSIGMQEKKHIRFQAMMLKHGVTVVSGNAMRNSEGPCPEYPT